MQPGFHRLRLQTEEVRCFLDAHALDDARDKHGAERVRQFIDRVLRARGDQKAEASVRVDVASLAGRFPLYPERLA